MHFIPELQDNMFLHALGRRAGAAQTRWNRLTAEELATASSERGFARTVSSRYGLDMSVAAREVQVWISSQT